MFNKRNLALLTGLIVIIALAVPIISQDPNIYYKVGEEVLGIFKSNQKPGSFQITNLTSNCVNNVPQVSGSWSSSIGAVSYSFQRKYPWSNSWEDTGDTSDTTITDATWAAGYDTGIFSYRVQATNNRGTTNTDPAQIVISQCQNGANPTPITTITPIPTPEPTTLPILAPGAKPAPHPTVTPTPTPKPTVTPTPVPTLKPTPTPTPIPISTPMPSPTSISKNKIQWGAFVGDQTTDAASFESLVGKKMNLQALFIGWGDQGPFPLEFGPTVRDQNKTLVIFWEPNDGNVSSIIQPNYNYDSILNGSWDSYLTKFAQDAKTYNGPVILAPFNEPNGNWDPWDGTVNGNTPAKFISVFQYIHKFFSVAPNVKFAWDVNNVSVPDIASNSIAAYYPGSAYVDIVAVDGFNFNDPWQTFNDIFSSAMPQLISYNKPIYILSMASAQGSQKAAWITDALTVQIPKYPQIAGWMWFNMNKEQNWLVNSDANSLKAFQSALP